MLIKLFTVTSLLAGLSVASPVDITTSPELTARGSSEGLHLVNCREQNGNPYSIMAYYANDAVANGNPNSATPSDYTYITKGAFQTWEGRTTKGYFSSSGVTFSATINSNAASQSTGTKVGTGYNGSNWNCYKDNGNELWYPPSGGICARIYYCLKP